jgi:hypothetical protein
MPATAHDPLFYRQTGHGPAIALLSGCPAPWDALAFLVAASALPVVSRAAARPSAKPPRNAAENRSVEWGASRVPRSAPSTQAIAIVVDLTAQIAADRRQSHT